MKYCKIISLIVCSILWATECCSQKTNTTNLEISGSAVFALEDGYPLWGSGINAKLLWPVGQKENQLVANLGLDVLMEESELAYGLLTASIAYRKNFKNIFVEPKLGLGMTDEFNYRSAISFAGFETGIRKGRWRFSMDYKFIVFDIIDIESTLHRFGLNVGYDLRIGK